MYFENINPFAFFIYRFRKNKVKYKAGSFSDAHLTDKRTYGAESVTRRQADKELQGYYPVSYGFMRHYCPLAIDIILDIRKMKNNVTVYLKDGRVYKFTNCKVNSHDDDGCLIELEYSIDFIKGKVILWESWVNEAWIDEIFKNIDVDLVERICVDLVTDQDKEKICLMS